MTETTAAVSGAKVVIKSHDLHQLSVLLGCCLFFGFLFGCCFTVDGSIDFFLGLEGKIFNVSNSYGVLGVPSVIYDGVEAGRECGECLRVFGASFILGVEDKRTEGGDHVDYGCPFEHVQLFLWDFEPVLGLTPLSCVDGGARANE